MAGENQVQEYKDFSYRGASQNTDFVITGVEVIKNIIKMYLMSSLGDYGRDVTKGGPLITIIGKEMTDDYQSTIEDRITEALSVYSNIIMHTTKIVKNLETRNWDITIYFSDVYNKFSDSTNLSIKG